LKKFEEALRLGQEGLSLVIHGGDIFHRHDPTHSLIRDVNETFKAAHARDLVINPGNHDFMGGCTDTLRRSGFGILQSTGIFKSFKPDYEMYDKFILRAIPYQIEYPESVYWFENKKPGRFYVVLAHDMLTTRPVPFPHREIKKLKTNADLVLCSHWHSQFIKRIGKTLFVNSGPLDAQTTVEGHIKPAVAVINMDKTVEAEFKFLKHTGYEEIEAREEDEKAIGLADDFIAELKQSDVAEGADMLQAIRLVGEQSGYDPKIVQKTLDRVQELQSCV